MVRHIVCWKLKDDVNKSESIKRMKDELTALVGKIEGLVSLEVGECFSGEWDAALCSVLESREALEVYRTHPEHVKAQQFVHTVMLERSAADFEF